MGVTNEFGEFPVPDDAEPRRKEAYASLSRIDPAKAIGSKPCFPPKFDGPAVEFCERCAPTVGKLVRIFEALGVSADYLLGIDR